MNIIFWLLPALAITSGPDDEVKPEPKSARLVAFDDLQKRLDEPKLILLDARPRSAYDEGHIPGAISVDIGAAEALAGKPDGLRDEKAWQEWLTPLGINPDSQVLIYDANRQLAAARVWWLLTYLSVEDAGLVDGGFPLWKDQGRPVSTESATPATGTLVVRFQKDRHADREDVLSALKSGEAQVVDARSLAEHTGTTKMSNRAGRIPEACHVEWKSLVDEQGRFIGESQLRQSFEAAGIEAGKPAISHCQGGGRASVDAFVLERLGIPTRNYYLGWSDWGNADETPVETGEKKP